MRFIEGETGATESDFSIPRKTLLPEDNSLEELSEYQNSARTPKQKAEIDAMWADPQFSILDVIAKLKQFSDDAEQELANRLEQQFLSRIANDQSNNS
jgi:hypothetical protein